MSDALDEMTEQESKWVTKWEKLVEKKPEPLILIIDANSSEGNVDVYLPTGSEENNVHGRWIRNIKKHLKDFPDGEGWLLSNIDGWHFGKGIPTVKSGTTYGPWGATGSHSDDFWDHYIHTLDVDYGEVPEDWTFIGSLPSQQGNLEIRKTDLDHRR